VAETVFTDVIEWWETLRRDGKGLEVLSADNPGGRRLGFSIGPKWCTIDLARINELSIESKMLFNTGPGRMELATKLAAGTAPGITF